MPRDYRRDGLGRTDYRRVGRIREETPEAVIMPVEQTPARHGQPDAIGITITFRVKGTDQRGVVSFGFRSR